MTTKELFALIGERKDSVIVAPPHGNAEIYTNGYAMVDPCYVDPDNKWPQTEIAIPMRAAFPWGAIKPEWRKEWQEFQIGTYRCFYRVTDGDGCFYGCQVDTAQLVVVPIELLHLPEVAQSGPA